MWDFQSDSTLYDALEGALGKFPEDVADIFLGGEAISHAACWGESLVGCRGLGPPWGEGGTLGGS